jgi:hypothetical protein
MGKRGGRTTTEQQVKGRRSGQQGVSNRTGQGTTPGPEQEAQAQNHNENTNPPNTVDNFAGSFALDDVEE